MITKSQQINEILTIGRYVAENYDITLGELCKNTRKQLIVLPRQIAHTLCLEMIDTSSTLIGRVLGNKDHATVFHSRKAISDLLDTDFNFKIKYLEINEDLKKRLNINNDKNVKLRKETYRRFKESKILVNAKSAAKRHKIQYKLINSMIY